MENSRLDGKVGIVSEWSPSQRQYRVDLGEPADAVYWAKAINLELITFKQGERVMVYDLNEEYIRTTVYPYNALRENKKRYLNGNLGVIQRWLRDENVWEVNFEIRRYPEDTYIGNQELAAL